MELAITKKNYDDKIKSISVTQLTSFKSSDILEKAMKYIHCKELSPVIYYIPLIGLVNTW